MHRSKLLPLLAVLAIIGFASNSFAQTPTATATATATPTTTATPTGVATPVGYPLSKGITNFGYIGTNNGMATISSTITSTGAINIGGRVVKMKAGTALTIGQAVTLSTSADNTVIVASSGAAPHVVGVVVGRTELSQDQIGLSPKIGDVAIIQIDGVVQMVADSNAITRGNTVDVSTAITGGATNGSAAGTADSSGFGTALNTTAGGGTVSKVFVLLETARSF